MFFRKTRPRTLTSGLLARCWRLLLPALAQTVASRKVVDENDVPVRTADTVTAIPDHGARSGRRSDKNGNYIIVPAEIGPVPDHRLEEGVGEDEARAAVKIGNFTTTNFKLSRAARVSEEQAKKNQEIKKFFEAGVTAANAGNHQAAVDAFTAAGVAMPTCADCYFNVGVSQQQMKNNEAAEAAFKKAIELRPNYPEAYNALAVLYTQDKKMDLAAAASAKSAELSIASGGGGNADSLYSAGVGLWNANNLPMRHDVESGAEGQSNTRTRLHDLRWSELASSRRGGRIRDLLKLEPAGKKRLKQRRRRALNPC